MIRAYVYKLTPTRAQAEALDHELWAHRVLYNAALEHRALAWKRGHHSVSYAEQNRELTLIRRDDPRYGQSSSSAQQRTLRRLDAAFAAFFRRVKAGQTPGYPKPKTRRQFDTISWTAGNGARLTFDADHRRSGRLHLHGIGAIKCYVYRDPEGVAKQIAVTRRASGWWLSVTCALPDPQPAPSTLPAVGIDLGLRAFVATSDGETIAPPRPYERGLRRLRRDQRRVARRQRGSGRRRAAVQILAREAERVANRRRDWHRKTAKQLSERYGLVAVEDLAVARMVRTDNPAERYPWAKRGLNRGVHDAAWASFVPILERRLVERGGHLVRVDPANTTRRCVACGQEADVSIFRRVARCPACGVEQDQDVRAAQNVLGRDGWQTTTADGQGHPPDDGLARAKEVLGRARLRAALRTIAVKPGRLS